ncbi:unnamed protein product [Victoria cruziana]
MLPQQRFEIFELDAQIDGIAANSIFLSCRALYLRFGIHVFQEFSPFYNMRSHGDRPLSRLSHGTEHLQRPGTYYSGRKQLATAYLIPLPWRLGESLSLLVLHWHKYSPTSTYRK